MKKNIFCLVLALALAFASAALSEGQEAPVPAGPEACRTVGARVLFGHYPQTAEGDDMTPIEWEVMEVDEENHKAFLLSRYGLDSLRYNRYCVNITWEHCDLRAWLNDDFLNRAFTEEEQAAILLTDVDNSLSQCYGWGIAGGNDTQDKLFLLSYAEVHKFFNVQFGVKNNVAARFSPTAYASKRGARQDNWRNKTAEGITAGWYFLRSPGSFKNCVAAVGTDGSLYHTYVDTTHAAVRPAFWLDLEADIF